MILRRARVENFRSIVDSGEVVIEEGTTVLIGKNEQGKSNFLKALASFNQDRKYSPNDLPKHLRPVLDAKNPDDLPILSLWFGLDEGDRVALGEIIKDLGDSAELLVRKAYSNKYSYLVSTEGQAEKPIEFASPDTEPKRKICGRRLRL